MVPADQIVKKAIDVKADIVGLSGLITPSLQEMVNVATEMQRAGLTIPLFVGGATTSEMHAALKIAPAYDGPVIWTKDAAQVPLAAAHILKKEAREQEKRRLDERYAQLRAQYAEKQQLLSLDEARNKKLDLWGDKKQA